MTRSRLIGLLGSGISGSFSPALHEGAARDLGIPLVYRIIDGAVIPTVRQSWRDALLRAGDFGYDAMNVTVPAKQIVMDVLDEVDADAAALGAVNTVLFVDGRTVGYNTDFAGFVDGLRDNVPNADLSSVVQIGAGGAGSAVAYGLLREGAQRITIADIERERAQELVGRLAPQFPQAQLKPMTIDEITTALPTASGLVNTTPVGMAGHAPGSPVDLDLLHGDLWVADAVYKPRATPLITRARELGCATADGGGMIVGQAVRSFTLFTGAAPDITSMHRRLDELTA